MTLPKQLQKYAAIIDGYDDESASGNGLWLYYKRGWKSDTDYMGCQHQDHYDTVRELARSAKYALRCDCPDCKT